MAMNKNGYGCVLALWMVRGCRSFVCLCYCQLVALAGCVDRWGDCFIGERVVSSRFLSASHCVKGSRAAGHQPRMPVVWIDFPVLRAKVFSFMVPLHGQVPSAHRGKAQVCLHAPVCQPYHLAEKLRQRPYPACRLRSATRIKRQETTRFAPRSW